MRTARAFSTYVKSGLVLVCSLTLFILTSSPGTSPTARSEPSTLPKRIGRLNDYANVLTMEDQRSLEGKIQELEEEGIGLTVLISRHDPYSEPGAYASEIRREWGIREKKNESLIVFVEEDDGWAVKTFLRQSITGLFSSGELRAYQDSVRKTTENGDVREATLESVNLIHQEAFPGEEVSNEEEKGESSPTLVLLVAGISGGLVLITAVIIWEARHRCPRCGSRLETVNFGAGESERHCPECGYHERG
ncbi:MAG: TPM domain-containing protein [Candidatus Acetothermia bacterium]